MNAVSTIKRFDLSDLDERRLLLMALGALGIIAVLLALQLIEKREAAERLAAWQRASIEQQQKHFKYHEELREKIGSYLASVEHDRHMMHDRLKALV